MVFGEARQKDGSVGQVVGCLRQSHFGLRLRLLFDACWIDVFEERQVGGRPWLGWDPIGRDRDCIADHFWTNELPRFLGSGPACLRIWGRQVHLSQLP